MLKKAAAIVSLAFIAGIGAYLFWAYPRLPAAAPLRWNMANMPVAFGSPAAFVGIPGAVTLGVAALFWTAARARPKAAWLAQLALAGVLFFVHVSTQAALGAVPSVPVNVALFGGLVAVALALVLTFVLRRRPAPKRVQPF